MSIDYQGIIKEIKDDEVIKLMQQLGADRYEEREDYILFPTICHNINSIDASLKLYFYRDTKLFMCYTECGGMNIFKFLETYYKTRGIEYNWYTDILDVITNISSFSPKEEFYIPYRERLIEKYRKKNQVKKLQVFDDCALDVFIKKYPISAQEANAPATLNAAPALLANAAAEVSPIFFTSVPHIFIVVSLAPIRSLVPTSKL